MEKNMKKVFEQYEIYPEDKQIRQLEMYYENLREWNKKINLTSIVEREEVIWKHFLDSALIMKSKIWKEEDNHLILDVGTGAGFPGMVLAILNPDKQFYLLDSLKKRIDYLEGIIHELQLDHVKCFHGRAEVYGRREDFRNQFDMVVSRAVAELPVLMEYCIPFVKKEGFFVSYKGKRMEEELHNSVNAFEKLSAEYHHTEQFSLKNGESRYLLYIKNCDITNEKYPRKEGKPKKKPL